MAKNTKSNYYSILANSIVPLGGLSTDIYLPSFPAMVSEFQATRTDVQLTMTAYVLAMGIAQLLAGPISDALGRKKQILAALLLQMIAIIAIVFAMNIYHVMLARFIQGLGAAFMIVPARAILNDSYHGDELKKKFNYLTISFALSPIVAPFIGGYCEYYAGWRSCFYFVFAYALFILLFVFFTFDETLQDKKSFRLHDMWHNYRLILSNRLFFYATSLLCILFGYTSIGNVLSPFIFQTHLHFSALSYGYIALFFGLAWFLGNVTNRLVFNISPIKKVQFSLSCHSCIILVLLITSMMGIYNASLTIVCFFILILTTGLIFPLFVAEGLSLFPQIAASANACLFSLTWIAFALYTLLAAFLPVKSLTPLAIAYICINGFSYLVYSKVKNALPPPVPK
jgi:Bcr/CflA subfamily drug resistance transporter